MRIWTLSRRTFLGIICILLGLLLFIFALVSKTTSASATNKKLPIYSVETDDKKIAITFDAAWTNQDTDDIIKILKKHNATATFFIVGDWAEKFPESVKAFYGAGHTIANHSDTHKAFSKCTRKKIKEEIVNCNKKLEKITGEKVSLLRAPSGDYTNESLEVTESLGMYMIQWDNDSLDYTGLTVDEIVNRVISRAHNGSIVLFHNGVDTTAEALDKILAELSKQGYSFVSVNDLIYKENYSIDHAGRQHLNTE